MDSLTVGLIGGTAGAVVGTYRSLKNTNGPRERAFMIRWSVAFWLGLLAFLTGLALLPMAWRAPLCGVSTPLLIYVIRKAYERWALAKAEDQAEAGVGSSA